MMLTPTLTLTVFAMFSAQVKLSERKLSDIAVISIPRSIKEEMFKGIQDDHMGRLTFTFATSYFWASFGSSTAYKQQMFVSVMAPDATNAEYEEYPKHWGLSYDKRTTLRKTTVGSGNLTIYEGLYVQNTLSEPSHTFVYVDNTRRLQIWWHAVKKEIALEEGVATMERVAASFRLLKDPVEKFAEMRDRPRKEDEERANRLAATMEMLKREGYGPLEPGKPMLKDGVYFEWMIDPEPRYQLLVPLGRVRTTPETPRGSRPRPVRLDLASGDGRPFPGTVGWREFIEGEWDWSNHDNAYMPFEGIRAIQSETMKDPSFTYFYYSATVRVNHSFDLHVSTAKWFYERLPEIQQLWRSGKLVRGGTPESE